MSSFEFCDLKKLHTESRFEVEEAIRKVIAHGKFINGPEVKELEETLARYVGVKYAVGVSSGTDALLASLMALDIGREDYVITTPFSFISTATMVPFLDAKPLFVDVDTETYNLDPEKLKRFLENPRDTAGNRIPIEKIKCVIVVDLFGQPANYDKIREVLSGKNIKVIEDAAQSFGAMHKGKRACSLGDISITSFFPAKPLGCYGDGGMVFTDDEKTYEKIKLVRNHGQSARYQHTSLGLNLRLDTLQAAILLAKFKRFSEKEIGERNSVVKKYNEKLSGKAVLPFVGVENVSSFAQYSIQVDKRDELREFLQNKGIPTAIHYPKPLHLQEVFRGLGYKEGDFPIAEYVSKRIISLPMDPLKTDEEIDLICKSVNEFLEGTNASQGSWGN